MVHRDVGLFPFLRSMTSYVDIQLSQWVGDAHSPFPPSLSLSLTHGQCDVRPMVTFPAKSTATALPLD